ncbi:MAG: hypothetical protein WCL27_07465 [Betaproteobacteria bacterium]
MLSYDCPCCHEKISFFSRTVHAWGKEKYCPHCGRAIKPGLAFGRFFLLAFAIGLPIKMLGLYIPSLAFFQSPIFSGLLMVIFTLMCFRFDAVEEDTKHTRPRT